MSEGYCERTVTVINRAGLHFRPADLLVRTASRYSSHIEIEKAGQSVDCKSILGILTLAAQFGSQLRLIANGIDAEEAVNMLSDLFAQGFHELESGVSSPDVASQDG